MEIPWQQTFNQENRRRVEKRSKGVHHIVGGKLERRERKGRTKAHLGSGSIHKKDRKEGKSGLPNVVYKILPSAVPMKEHLFIFLF